MPDNKTQNEEALDNAGSNTAEAQALIEMKNKLSTLEKENADLKNAKKKYYDTILNGGTVDEAVEPKHRPSKEIREELVKNAANNTNLANWMLSIELDDAVREETGKSSFLPKGHEVSPTVQEIADADWVHDTIKGCIDEAEGSPEKFNALLKLQGF